VALRSPTFHFGNSNKTFFGFTPNFMMHCPPCLCHWTYRFHMKRHALILWIFSWLIGLTIFQTSHWTDEQLNEMDDWVTNTYYAWHIQFSKEFWDDDYKCWVHNHNTLCSPGHFTKMGLDYNTFTYMWTSSVCEFNGTTI